MSVGVSLHGDLDIFLPRELKGRKLIIADLERRTSIKDYLEAYGIPHTEIYRIIVNGRETGFDRIVAESDEIEVTPFAGVVDLSRGTLLRKGLDELSFVVDVNVAKLARLLRMAGLDTFFDHGFSDAMLAEKAGREKKILLTRDRALLKRKNVIYGRMVRSTMPGDQLAEIISLYGLQDRIRPFTRCLDCNGILLPVEKDSVRQRLEPLTEKYYDDFHYCSGCDKIFWPGSHRHGMLRLLGEIQ